MNIYTTETIPDKRITETLGLVRGNTIRARHIGSDIMAGLKSRVVCEMSEYTKLLAEAREQSIDRMKAEADRLGADAVVGIRFTTSVVWNSFLHWLRSYPAHVVPTNVGTGIEDF